MSCQDQIEHPASACHGLASSGVIAQGNRLARQIMDACRAGMSVPYEMALMGAGDAGDGFSLDDLLQMGNPANERDWTLAHELTSRGRMFSAPEVRALGNPRTLGGVSLVDVIRERHGRLPYAIIPESFDGPGAFAEWLTQDVSGSFPELPEYIEWTGTISIDTGFLALCFAEPQDIQQVKSLMGYVAKVNLAIPGEDGWNSENLILPEQPDGGQARLFIWPCDLTKTISSDIVTRFNGDDDVRSEVYKGVAYTLRNGSPVRKTNSAGPGTKGTRLVDGIDCDVVWAFG